ncbi:hypothetical protein B0H19DRAFT_1197658, partial [Mycena capillaripes]
MTAIEILPVSGTEPDTDALASERAAHDHVPSSSAVEGVHILHLEDFVKFSPSLSLAMKQDQLEACPALSLPNELMSEIFVHFLPVYPKLPPSMGLLSPYLLCHICRRWRNIALTTPALWRGISLSLRKVRRLPQKLHFL